MKNIFKISLLFLCFFAVKAEAFTCTALVGGGNWNAAGTWTNCNSTFPQASDDVVLDITSGSVAVNVATLNLKSLTMTGYLGTLSGTQAITVIGATASTNNVIFDGTINWTGTLNLNPTTATANLNLTTNTKLITAVSMAGSAATVQLQDNLSFTAAKTDTFTIASSLLDMNGKTISGNSITNRILMQSSVLGTQRTITRNSGVFANADFRDIDLEASYNCSAITGLCGDAGGNSADFTFTAAQTQTNSGTASFTWSTNTNWTGSTPQRVPLPQDDVVINGIFISGRTITVDMPRLGKNIDASGATWAGTKPVWSLTTPGTIYGSLIFPNQAGSGFTITTGGNTTILEGDRSGSFSLNQNGATVTTSFNITVQAIGSTYTLQSAFNTGTGTLTHSHGTFNDGGFSVTTTVYSGSFATTRAIVRSGTWTIIGTGTSYTTNTTTGLTQTDTGTIVMSDTTTTSKQISAGSLSGSNAYNNLTITGQNVTLTGSNTFNGTIALSTAGRLYPLPTFFTTATTQTVANFTVNSTSTVDRVVASSTSATNATLTKSGAGQICLDFVTFQDLTGSPVSTWYAGANSVDTGGTNVNITFTACPVSIPPIKVIQTGQMIHGSGQLIIP